MKNYKKRMASELNTMSEYYDEQLKFNRMIMEGHERQNKSWEEHTKASVMMGIDAEENIRDSQVGKEMATESAEIELLKLDQMFVVDASKVQDFGELVKQEASKLL
jgi:uncharacterized protein YaeQ